MRHTFYARVAEALAPWRGSSSIFLRQELEWVSRLTTLHVGRTTYTRMLGRHTIFAMKVSVIGGFRRVLLLTAPVVPLVASASVDLKKHI